MIKKKFLVNFLPPFGWGGSSSDDDDDYSGPSDFNDGEDVSESGWNDFGDPKDNSDSDTWRNNENYYD